MKTKSTDGSSKRVSRLLWSTLSLLVLAIGCSEAPTQVSTAPQGALIQGEPIDAAPEATPSDTPATTSPSADPVLVQEIQESPSNHITEAEQTLPVSSKKQTLTVPESLAKTMKEAPETPVEVHPGNVAAAFPKEPLVVTETKVTEDASSSDHPDDNPVSEGGYLKVSFEKLASFEYQMPEDLMEPIANEDGKPYKEQIPPSIKSLNKKAISLKGFMLPLKVEKGLVTEMLIMRDQSMCCYGTVPKINEWVSVRMDTKGVKPVMDEPVTIFGTLKVGEVLENGYLVGIYEMDGQDMTVASTP